MNKKCSTCSFWSVNLIINVEFLQGFGHSLKQTACCCCYCCCGLLSVRLSHGLPARWWGCYARRPRDALQPLPLVLVHVLCSQARLRLLQRVGKSQRKHIHLLIPRLCPPLSFSCKGGLSFFFVFFHLQPIATLGLHHHLLHRQIVMLVVKKKARLTLHARQSVEQRHSQGLIKRFVFLLVGKKFGLTATVDAAMRAGAFLVAFQALVKTIIMNPLTTAIRDHQGLGLQTHHTPFRLHDPWSLTRCTRRALLNPLPFRKGVRDTPMTL